MPLQNSPSRDASKKSVTCAGPIRVVEPISTPWKELTDSQSLFDSSLQGESLLPQTGARRRGAIDFNATGSVSSDWWHRKCAHRLATTVLSGRGIEHSETLAPPSIFSRRGSAASTASTSSFRSHSSSVSSSSTLYSNSSSLTCVSSGSFYEDRGISFIPDSDTHNPGVAMSELEYGHGVLFGDDLVTKHLGLGCALTESARLLINWPGYTHLNLLYPLSFTGEKGSPLSVSQLGTQIANIFRRFLTDHWKDFDPSQSNGVRLGPSHVTFGHLRLRSVCFRNGSNAISFEDGVWIAEVSYAVT